LWRKDHVVKLCLGFGSVFLRLSLFFPSVASLGQALSQDKNPPDFRSVCEKEPDVEALQNKVLYGYPEMEPCYEIALIECQLRGTTDPNRKAELQMKENEYLAKAKGGGCSNSNKSSKLNILVSRQYGGGLYTDRKTVSSDSCITGYVAINGATVAYTLELPYRNNQSFVSSIPAGKYDATIKFEGGSGPYTNEGYRIALLNVPGGRSGVQIHIGNYPTQIEGCILVGTKVHPDTCALEDSRGAYQKLKKAIQDQAESDASAEEKKITVTIQNTGWQKD
jgi:hypothetical protein